MELQLCIAVETLMQLFVPFAEISWLISPEYPVPRELETVAYCIQLGTNLSSIQELTAWVNIQIGVGSCGIASLTPEELLSVVTLISSVIS